MTDALHNRAIRALEPFASLTPGEPSDAWEALRVLVNDLSDPAFTLALSEVIRRPRFNALVAYAGMLWEAAAMLPSVDAVEHYLLRAVSEHPNAKWSRALERRAAAALTYGQSPEVLDVMLCAHRDAPRLTEIFACWIHQHVAVGDEVGPAAKVFHDQLKEREHPLAALPLTLHPMEEGALACRVIRPPRWDLNGNWLSCPGAQAFYIAVQSRPTDAGQELPAARALAILESQRDDYSAGYVDDLLVPNGKWETGVFALEREVENLGDMELDSLGDADDPEPFGKLDSEELHLSFGPVGSGLARSPFRVVPLTTQMTVARLLAFSTGGAYGQPSAAYGRLYAWRALAAWTGHGHDGDLSLDEIVAVADRSQFGHFLPSHEWSFRVVESGFACLRPDRQTLVVSAFTDSD